MILSLYLPMFLFSLGRAMTLPSLPLYAKSLGAGLPAIGLIIGLNGLGALLFDLPAGLLISKIRHYPAMVLGLIGIGIGALGMAVTQSPVVLALFNFLSGSALSLWHISRLTYSKEILPIHTRGKALSFLGGTLRLGNFIGPTIGGFLGKYVGLAFPFYGKFVCLLIAAGLVIAFIPSSNRRKRGGIDEAQGAGSAGAGAGRGTTEPTSDAERRMGSGGSGSKGRMGTGGVAPRCAFPSDGDKASLLRTVSDNWSILLTAGGAMFTLQLMRIARQILYPLWGDFLGLDVAAIGLIISASSGIELAVFAPAGFVMDSRGRKWVALPCIIVLAASFGLLPLTAGFWSFLLIGLLAGVGNGIGAGINMTFGNDFAPVSSPERFLGVWQFISDTGNTAGPLIVGNIAGALSLGYSGLAIAAIGVIGMVVMWAFVQEPLGR